MYDLRDQLYEDDYEVIVEKLHHAMTVCTSATCSECINGIMVYKKVCDDKCRWAPTLRLCVAMNKLSGICKRCGCHFTEHRWQTSKTEVKKKQVIRQDVVEKIVSKDRALGILQGHLRLLEDRREKLLAEKSQVLAPCAKLSTFLQQNILLKTDQTNDFLYYLNQRASAMRKQESPDEATKEALAELEQLELEYKKKLNDIKQSKEAYTAAAVKSIIEEL